MDSGEFSGRPLTSLEGDALGLASPGRGALEGAESRGSVGILASILYFATPYMGPVYESVRLR